ncbi:MAG: hypothetical protein RL368_1293, partial [Pseudomonadota bacterium]
MRVLVVAEHDNQSLKAGVLNTIQAARKIASEVVVLVAGHEASSVAQAAAQVEGVSKVLHADAAQYAHALAENIANLVLSIAKEYTHILAPASTFGKNFLPRVAALLDVAQVSDVIQVVDAETFVRPIYAGNVLATVKSTDAIKVLTIRTTGFDAVAATGGSAAIESLAAQADSGLASFVEQTLTKSSRPELGAAKIIVSGGRGMGSSENFAILEALADKLGAAIGASRAAVDAG